MEFILGLLTGFALSFFTEAGKDFYRFIKRRINPSEPDPVKRDSGYCPVEIKGKDPRWVTEDRIYYFEDQGYRFYRTEKGEKVFHENQHGKNILMFKPDV